MIRVPGQAPIPGEFCSPQAVARAHRGPSPDGELLHDCIMLRALRTDPLQRYYLFVPSTWQPGTELVVLVHGISRNARDHMRAFASLAARSGTALLAPLFSREFCRDYQTLGWGGGGRRADLLLQEMVTEVASEIRARQDRFRLFGHSGGAQFAHRFAFAWPAWVSRLAVCAAGHYTMPDPALRFPLGLQHSHPHAPVLRAEEFLRIPVLVAVGDRDTQRDTSLRQDPQITEHQGRHRVDRARRWADALRAAGKTAPDAAPVQFTSIPRAGHRFADTVRRGLCEIIWPWLTGPLPASTPGVARPLTSNKESS